jgi:hypothetical protein
VSILVRYSPAALTLDKYHQVDQQLQADWPPEGLEYHVAFGPQDNVRVSEIWSSREQWEAWSQRLLPVLQEAGVDLSTQPELLEVHREERF